ncbi:hypothetical protein NYA10_29715, partial [Burkholderia thailandensis]|nr:hypothetical protein [Burkholderia thailandensis]
MDSVVSSGGVQGVRPVVLGGLRLLIAEVAGVFVVRGPHIPLRVLALEGSTMLLGQFVLHFAERCVGRPAGLAALVLQEQASWTVVPAILVSRDRKRGRRPRKPAVTAPGSSRDARKALRLLARAPPHPDSQAGRTHAIDAPGRSAPAVRTAHSHNPSGTPRWTTA